MEGFFSDSSKQSNAPLSTIPLCGACGLHKKCISPRMKMVGKGRKKILCVVDSPGEFEDRDNVHLYGRAGQLLRQHLGRFGVSLDKDCWLTNAVICRRNKKDKPTDEQIKMCRPNLLKRIKQTDPNIIILFGETAMKSFLPTIFKEQIGTTSRWGGSSIPCQKPNAWICPTFHPSFLLSKNNNAAEIMFHEHLAATLKHKDKPKVIRDQKYRVNIIYKPAEAARVIEEIMKQWGQFDFPVAFDYETNCLKPDGEGTEILSCAVSNGTTTIAYPWMGEAIEATSSLLKSPIPKIASNLKFEERWTKAKLGHRVKNWWWDTMIGAHVIDNKAGITSVKFQAFVLLGAKSWDDHIKPYKNSTGGTKFNRMKEVDLKDLLMYNGLDALYEYKVAKKQVKIIRRRK